MTIHEAPVSKGERLLVWQPDPDGYIKKHETTLQTGVLSSPDDRYVKYMLGVCYQLKHECATAIKWYNLALDGATDYELGTIYRNMAESYSCLYQYTNVKKMFNQAFAKLTYSQYPIEHATTLGLLAGTELRTGELMLAIKHLGVADAMLSRENNPRVELYNKLQYAATLSHGQQLFRSRLVALKGLKLALLYGFRSDQLRAIMLLFGGHRLDYYALQRQRK